MTNRKDFDKISELLRKRQSNTVWYDLRSSKELRKKFKKVVDTGVTYKFSPVSDTVAEFEVYNFDSEKHTFDSVYITYNLNYFDDPN